MVLGLTRATAEGKYFSQFPRYDDIRPRGHVECWVGNFLMFEGSITKVVENAGYITQITVTGYGICGLNDDWYKNNEVNVSSDVSQIQATQKSAGSIIQDVLRSCAPLIRIAGGGDFQDPGTIYIPGSFYGQTPAQILEAITKVGSSQNVVWDFTVYEDRRLTLKPRVLSGAPDYTLPFDKTTTVTSDFNSIAGQARVEFQLPDWDTTDKGLLIPDHNGNYQTGDKLNNNFKKLYGFLRKVYIKAGTMTGPSANQFRDTYLVVNQNPIVSGQIVREKGRGFEVSTGTEVPTYMVRAGQWVQVGDKTPLVIVQTKWTNKPSFECEIGKSAQHWDAFMSYLAAVSRHVVMGTNPLSGMRQ